MSEFSVNMPPRLPAASAAANVLTAVVPNPPRHLTQMDLGTILRGTVQGRDNEGLLVVSTDTGVLKLQTPANLAPGSQVLLEVRATGDRLQVLILSVEAGTNGPASGQVPPRGGGGTAPAPPPTSGSAGGTAPPPRAPAPVPVTIVGSLLQGTIIQAPPDTLTQLFRSLLPSPAQTAVPVPPVMTPTQPGAAILPGATIPIAPTGDAAIEFAPPAPNTGQPNAAQAIANQAGAEQAPDGAAPATSTPANIPAPPRALGSRLQSEVQAKIESLFTSAGSPNPAGTGAGSAGAASSGSASSGMPSTGGLPTGFGAQQPQLPQNMAASLKLLAALPTGTEVKLRLIAISPGPGQPVILPAAAAGAPHVMAGIMSGRIIGYTPTGHAVLHSPLGAIVLQGALAVPVGTELSFAVEPAIPVPSAAATAPSLPQFLLSLSRGWPSLMDAIALMRQANPNADPAAALAHLPQPGPKLAAGLVAAIQALRSGNIEALLGGLALLRAGSAERDETIRKLRQEFGQISNLAQDKGGVDWRCFFIPLLDDGTVRQINLFYRRDRGKERKGEDADKSGTRFIVEVDMSKMGPFQFDGLVREKRFDLMVRSHIALTPKMRHDIGALFQEALSIGEYVGNLQFQTVREFPVSPLEEIEKSATRVSA